MPQRRKDASELLRDYANGMTLRQCANKHGISMQRVHQIVKERAPEMMRSPGKGVMRDPLKHGRKYR